ncbi:hypothetical protein FRC16_005929 [Serendipita sp. 398]|nr:hypothetical protein FRC16_005929 [Serendipita sp. 398]
MSEELIGDSKIDQEEWHGEHWFVLGPSWKGIEDIRHMIVFGASYCETQPYGFWSEPTDEQPLGIEYPGITRTDGGANWVGHLVYKRSPPILVYNYAKSGHTVDGVQEQVQTMFPRTNPPSVALSPETSLFATWIGINDIGQSCSDFGGTFSSGADIERAIDHLFILQQELYDKGARNFLFIDVPPVDRSPAYRGSPKTRGAPRIVLWNMELQRHIRTFVTEKEATGPVTVLYFSSHKIFTSILDNPEEHGFPEEDINKSGGAIWVDELHPTSAVHAIFARKINVMLKKMDVR